MPSAVISVKGFIAPLLLISMGLDGCFDLW